MYLHSFVRPLLRIQHPIRLLSLRVSQPALAPRSRRTAGAATKTSLQGPLHRPKKAVKKASKPKPKRKKAKAKPVPLTTQIRAAKAGLSSDAKRALEPIPTAFNLYIKQEVSSRKEGPVADAFAQAAKKWKSLSDGEKSSYATKQEQTRAERDRAIQGLSQADKDAVRTFIRLRNKKTSAQTAKDGKKRSMVRRRDLQLTEQKTNPYATFVAEHYGDSDVQALQPTERFRKLAEKWKQSKA